MFGKYSLYIYLSYGAAAVMFIGLGWRVTWLLNQAKQLCHAALKESRDECNP